MRFVLAMLLIFPLTGCATTMGTVGTNRSACAVWKEISWSKKDTDQTIGEVKINNARRAVYCEK